MLSGEISQIAFLAELCPFFRIRLDHYQALNSQALAPACSALVYIIQDGKRGSVRDLFIPELKKTTIILWVIW